MAKKLVIDKEKILNHSKTISSDLKDYSKKELNPADKKTTLSVNQKSKNVYDSFENIMQSLKKSVENDSKNLEKMVSDFEKFDTEMGKKNSSRKASVKSAKGVKK